MRHAVLIGTAAMLIAAPAASPQTIPLGWSERVSAFQGRVVLVLQVKAMTVQPDAWSASVSVRNASELRVHVKPRFALVSGTRSFTATRFTPQAPAAIDRKSTWRGTIAGSGAPPAGTEVRVRFGEFRVAIAPGLVIRHVTRRSVRI
jgi:hypothetical protein